MVLHHHDRHDFGVSHAYNIHQYTIYILYLYTPAFGTLASS